MPVAQAASGAGKRFTLIDPARRRARQRSYDTWLRSQDSAEPHPAISRRIAISGETPLRPFNSSESDPRETPSHFAAAVTVRRRGLRQSRAEFRQGEGDRTCP